MMPPADEKWMHGAGRFSREKSGYLIATRPTGGSTEATRPVSTPGCRLAKSGKCASPGENERRPAFRPKTLANPTRRAIFERLVCDGEQTVRALTDRAGVSQPAVSKHLRVLKRAGLVRDRPEGRSVHDSAEPQALAPLVDWMSLYGAFWRDRLDRLETLLDRMDQ